ncbi:prophage tail fiber N-terminal domain-containing protein [Escherichia coli]|nr:prophage tail fiber N-terminal domain-containing protein [Escherichia coli]
MSVVISGALIDGAGIPMSGCHIILKSRVNTSEVVVRTVADVVTGNCGEYCFKAQTGKYCVYLKQDWRDEYCVGDIAVYDDSKPGTLNDFLTALDEGDLKPDVVKRFEELVAQAQQSAEAAAESERQAGQHVADAQQIKSDCETLADNVQQNAEAVAEDKNQVALLASSATQDAARAEQAVKDADKIVQKAVDKLDAAATLTGEATASAEAAAKSEQGAKQHRDEAQRIVDDLKGTNASTTQKGLVQLCSDTDNDSEELAATPKAVKAVMDETKTKAPLDSPAFTGTPTTPTPSDDAAGLETANAAFVRKLLAALVDSVPESLDTLKELADALGNDPNFSTTVLNALAGKQPLNDILTSLSGLVTAGNKLAYFTDKNVMALANLTAVGRVLIGQNSKSDVLNYLGLKSAATKDVQSDIYDRTEGRLAIPGAFGYGAIFTSARFFSPADGPSEFLSWVTEMAPGKYCVSQSWGANYNPILNIYGKNINFSGVVEIIIPDFLSINENQTEKDKLVIFYGVNGDVYINRLYSGAFMGWESLIFGAKNVADTLRSSGGVTNGYAYPDIGGLVFAAYCGKADDDAARKIWRGSVVAGSRLAVVSITAPHNPTGSYASTPQVVVAPLNLCPMAGTFVALSGSPLTSGGNTSAMIGLFVRIA